MTLRVFLKGFLAVGLGLGGGLGCGDSEATSATFHPALSEVCGSTPLGYYDAETLAITGVAANALHLEKTPGTFLDPKFLVVESRDNTISRYSSKTNTYERIADLGNDRSPYDLFADEDAVWVSNYLSNSVSKIVRPGFEVEEIVLENFKNPSGIAVIGDLLIVSNVNYLSPLQGFGESTVTAIEKTSGTFLWTETMPQKNVQFVDVIEWEGAKHLVLTSTGSVEFVEGDAVATSDGGVEVWTPNGGDQTTPGTTFDRRSVVFSVPSAQRSGALSRPAKLPGTPFLYFVSATAPELYKLDLGTMQWVRGADNPITLYETARDSLHHLSIGPDNIAYITAFNTDSLWRVDTRCDAVIPGEIPVGKTALLEGPHMIATVVAPEGGVDAYYLMSLSNTLSRVRFRANPDEE